MQRVMTIAFILSFFYIPCYAQTSDTLKRDFANEGEHANYEAGRFFKEQYIKQDHRRFAGTIVTINEHTYKYDNVILKVYDVNPDLKAIFEKGIFYPQLISNDTLELGVLKELQFLSNSPKIKRFRVWVFPKMSGIWTANAREYLIELTNESATETTDLKTFID